MVRRTSELPPGARKRQRTHAHLVDTAITLFAENGVESTSVLEISKSAGVSNGTFYHHFRDKEEIVHAVGLVTTELFIGDLTRISETIADPAERVAVGVQWLVERATSDAEIGQIIAQSIQERGEFRDRASASFIQDVAEGIEQGVFWVTPQPMLLDAVSATTASAIRERLSDGTAQAAVYAAELHLRMLGVGPQEAARLAEQARARLESWHGPARRSGGSAFADDRDQGDSDHE